MRFISNIILIHLNTPFSLHQLVLMHTSKINLTINTHLSALHASHNHEHASRNQQYIQTSLL